MISRRRMLAGVTALAAGSRLRLPARAADGLPGLAEALAGIEQENGGRLGVAVLDTASGAGAGHRPDERFPLCSTFKALAAAAVLKRVELGEDELERRITFTAESIVGHSPMTDARVGGEGMTLKELCEAAVTVSDNTAANLLLISLGGPPGLTAFLRGLGDTVTRIDRIEPDMSEGAPGDQRDTTSPAAMIADLQALVLGEALSPESRERLEGWLLAVETGKGRLPAGLPEGWRIGHKTGTGGYGSTNDVGILWPPGRPPLVVAAYLTETEAPYERREATLAAVARAVVAATG